MDAKEAAALWAQRAQDAKGAREAKGRRFAADTPAKPVSDDMPKGSGDPPRNEWWVHPPAGDERGGKFRWTSPHLVRSQREMMAVYPGCGITQFP